MPEYDDDTQQETPVIRQMRERIEAMDAELKESRSAKRELAFIKAGVDTTTKQGQYFMKAYEGDLSDIEALKSEATEVGVLQAVPSNTPTAEGSTAPGAVNLETGSELRQAVASGAVPQDGTGPSPAMKAQAAYDFVISQRGTDEDARAAWIASKAQSAMEDAGIIAKA